MSKVISILPNPHDQATWYTFYCPGCKCDHFFTSNWQFNGDFEKPTVSPSILVNQGRANPTAEVCHMFIKDGVIQFLGDCTHEKAGEFVPMEPE